MTASYKQYFTDLLVQRYGSQHQPSEADLKPLLAHVENSLRQQDYDDAVISTK